VATILVIDDEDLVRLTVRQALEQAGHTVIEAKDGRVGIAQHKKHNADLVLTDILMPEQEGIETITLLRREQATLPIIAMSGGGRSSNRNFLDVASKLGASRVINKPFDVDELVAAVDAALAG
jgi:DNA-binding response OmpR family regulator